MVPFAAKLVIVNPISPGKVFDLWTKSSEVCQFICSAYRLGIFLIQPTLAQVVNLSDVIMKIC